MLSCLNMRRTQHIRRAAVHVTVAGTTIAAHRSATATKTALQWPLRLRNEFGEGVD
jgi:hypothetical protein